MSEMNSVLTREHERRIESAIDALYRETDVPPPSVSCPIAPIGPILRRMAIFCVEIPGLTLHSTEIYLKERRIIRADLNLEGDPAISLAGFLYAAATGAFLFIDGKNPVTRRRFSIAHELGHLLLHFRPLLYEAEARLAAGETVESALYDAFSDHAANRGEENSVSAPGEYDQREREADAFSASLLLPAALTRQRFTILRETLPNLSEGGITERLAMDSLVSWEAMHRRLNALGLKNTLNEKRHNYAPAQNSKEKLKNAQAR
jgi:Zn-dependent peptidase ImmA (M78 family)